MTNRLRTRLKICRLEIVVPAFEIERNEVDSPAFHLRQKRRRGRGLHALDPRGVDKPARDER
jgi:hypothetical protein